MKPHEREVSFLRATVKHYSFVTGLAGKLAGRDGGPEDSSIVVNVLLNADITEGKKVKDPRDFPILEDAPYHNVLKGSLFQCCDLLSFIAGTFDAQDLKALKENAHPVPTEFTIETWNVIDDDTHKWQLTKKTMWEGVKWLDAAHTSDGGSRACAGIATFTCEKKTVQDIVDGEVIDIPKDAKTRYPRYALRDILKDKMDGPKHSPSYLG